MPIGADTASAQVATISGTSAKFTNPMQPGQQYWFVANTDCWVTVGATGGAAVADTAANVFVPAGYYLPLKSPDDGTATTNSFVHAIQDTASGTANLYRETT